MSFQSLTEHAKTFGLTIEAIVLPGHENAYRVFKGARQIFIGTDSAVEQFLSDYKDDRPGLMEGSMYDYRE